MPCGHPPHNRGQAEDLPTDDAARRSNSPGRDESSLGTGLPSARPGQEARTNYRSGELAAASGRPIPETVPPRPHPRGRLTSHQSIPGPPGFGVAGICLSALLLHEPFDRHPAPVLRVLRPIGDPLDAIEPQKHLGRRPPKRDAARFVRRTKELMMMRAEGLEPPSSFEHWHLKPACLPISPRPRGSPFGLNARPMPLRRP